MARPIQKKIKSLLEDFAKETNRFKDLNSKRDEAIRPARERFEAEVAKKDTKFAAKIESSRVRVDELRNEITLEMKKGYNLSEDSYALTRVETDDAFVEINTREVRDISAEDWITNVPTSEQNGAFWGTLKVLIGKAEKFRSDMVEKFAEKKASHSFNIRMK